MDDALVEWCWTIRLSSGHTFTCGVYHSDFNGLELQIGYVSRRLRYTVVRQQVSDVDVAMRTAHKWRTAMLPRDGDYARE